jgi:hypothetical protein
MCGNDTGTYRAETRNSKNTNAAKKESFVNKAVAIGASARYEMMSNR